MAAKTVLVTSHLLLQESLIVNERGWEIVGARPRCTVRRSKKPQKLVHRQSSLVHNGFERPPLQVLVVVCNRHASRRRIRMPQNIVASRNVMDLKSGALKRVQHRSRFDARKAGTQAAGRKTRICSFTGSSSIRLSPGMGRPSLRRLSR